MDEPYIQADNSWQSQIYFSNAACLCTNLHHECQRAPHSWPRLRKIEIIMFFNPKLQIFVILVRPAGPLGLYGWLPQMADNHWPSFLVDWANAMFYPEMETYLLLIMINLISIVLFMDSWSFPSSLSLSFIMQFVPLGINSHCQSHGTFLTTQKLFIHDWW